MIPAVAGAVKIKYTRDKQPALFRQGVKKTVTWADDCGGRYSLRTGKVRLADGSIHDAVLEFDDSSSGEHGGTGIWHNGRLYWQDASNFAVSIGKTDAEIFPYNYRPDMAIDGDHHCGIDGWSR